MRAAERFEYNLPDVAGHSKRMRLTECAFKSESVRPACVAPPLWARPRLWPCWAKGPKSARGHGPNRPRVVVDGPSEVLSGHLTGAFFMSNAQSQQGLLLESIAALGLLVSSNLAHF